MSKEDTLKKRIGALEAQVSQLAEQNKNMLSYFREMMIAVSEIAETEKS